MPDLISTADTEALLKETGGVLVTHDGETTYGHLEEVPTGFVGSNGAEVIAGKPSLVIPNGGLTGITQEDGIDDSLTTQEIDATGAVTGSPTSWLVRDIMPGDEDGGTIRLMLGDA